MPTRTAMRTTAIARIYFGLMTPFLIICKSIGILNYLSNFLLIREHFPPFTEGLREEKAEKIYGSSDFSVEI